MTALAVAAVVLALHAAPLSPRLVAWATAAALVLLALSVVQAVFGGIGEGAARAMNAALVAVGPPAIAYGVLHDLRTTRHVGLQSVLGVLSLYILVGMLFAFVYGAIDLLADESFFAGVETATVSECLYFSFITLTTVGYGDLSASSDLGHTLSIFEALIGQIYLVTVVSVLVSDWVVRGELTGPRHNGISARRPCAPDAAPSAPRPSPWRPRRTAGPAPCRRSSRTPTSPPPARTRRSRR